MTSEERDGAIPLREYVDIKITHEREIRDQWLKMNTELVADAKMYIADKLEKMNEMRDQINSERGQYVLRGEHSSYYKAVDGRIRILESFSSNLQGRIMVIGGVLGFIVILIAHFWK